MSLISSSLSSDGACTFTKWHHRPFSVIQETEWLIHSTLLTADLIHLCTKNNGFYLKIIIIFSTKILWFSDSKVLLLSHLTPTGSVQYFFCLASHWTWASVLYRLLTFQVPNLKSTFLYHDRFKLSVEFRGPVWWFWTNIFLQCEAVSRMPNPQAEGSVLIGCPPLLIQYICSFHPYMEA